MGFVSCVYAIVDRAAAGLMYMYLCSVYRICYVHAYDTFEIEARWLALVQKSATGCFARPDFIYRRYNFSAAVFCEIARYF